MLSEYCSNIADKCHIKIGSVHKLVANLGNKSKYVLHYRNLQLYLFKQSDWLEILIYTKKLLSIALKKIF